MGLCALENCLGFCFYFWSGKGRLPLENNQAMQGKMGSKEALMLREIVAQREEKPKTNRE